MFSIHHDTSSNSFPFHAEGKKKRIYVDLPRVSQNEKAQAPPSMRGKKKDEPPILPIKAMHNTKNATAYHLSVPRISLKGDSYNLFTAKDPPTHIHHPTLLSAFLHAPTEGDLSLLPAAAAAPPSPFPFPFAPSSLPLACLVCPVGTLKKISCTCAPSSPPPPQRSSSRAEKGNRGAAADGDLDLDLDLDLERNANDGGGGDKWF